MTTPTIPPKLANLAKGPPIDPCYRINIHFQPDLPYNNTTTVIQSLALMRQYHSQFKTGISNGGLLATSGRVQWEDDLFGNFYPTTSINTELDIERPEYGALNITNDIYGAAPRFGSCYFRLRADDLSLTFCFPGAGGLYSVAAVGTTEHFELDKLASTTYMDDPLDWRVEAHVHGPLLIPHDIDALVLDPSYYGTHVQKAAESLGCAVEWHPGYAVNAADLFRHESYRGAEFVQIAQKLADDRSSLTPAVLGKAYRASEYDQQQIKKVWHLLARYGRPWQSHQSKAEVTRNNI